MSYNYKTLHYPDGTVEHRIYQGTVFDEQTGKAGRKRERVRWLKKADESGNAYYEDADFPGTVRDGESIRHSMNASRNRSKNMIIEYARANEWEWFVTFTFNPELVDSFDYEQCYKKLHKWLNHIQERKAQDIKYLGVPEQHKSGRWHFHVLIGECNGLDLTNALELVKSPISGVYNLNAWKYGFSTATAVKDTKRVSTYITKYITKELAERTQGMHRYIKSRNLDRAIECAYNAEPERLEMLRLKLIADGCHFKETDTPYLGKVTYIQEERGET